MPEIPASANLQDARGHILLAHGSRDARWQATIEQLARPSLECLPHCRLAYMELCKPSLADAAIELHRQGIQQMWVLPLFLAAGRHLYLDIPQQITELERDLAIKIELLPAIGEHPALGRAIADLWADQLKPSGRPL